MHVTAMHLAFLTSRSVTKDTPLGRTILTVATRHNNRILRQQEDRALKRAIEQQKSDHAVAVAQTESARAFAEVDGVAHLEI